MVRANRTMRDRMCVQSLVCVRACCRFQARAAFWQLALSGNIVEAVEGFALWSSPSIPLQAHYEAVVARSTVKMESFHDFITEEHVSKAVFLRLSTLGGAESSASSTGLSMLFSDFVHIVCAGRSGMFFARLVKDRAKALDTICRCSAVVSENDAVPHPRHWYMMHILPLTCPSTHVSLNQHPSQTVLVTAPSAYVRSRTVFVVGFLCDHPEWFGFSLSTLV